MKLKYVLYALGIKVAITGVVLYVLWRRRQAQLEEFAANDILTNCRQYPKDEAPAAYKDFDAVLDSVKLAGLASEAARLKARFVIKDADMSLQGAA